MLLQNGECTVPRSFCICLIITDFAFIVSMIICAGIDVISELNTHNVNFMSKQFVNNELTIFGRHDAKITWDIDVSISSSKDADFEVLFLSKSREFYGKCARLVSTNNEIFDRVIKCKVPPQMSYTILSRMPTNLTIDVHGRYYYMSCQYSKTVIFIMVVAIVSLLLNSIIICKITLSIPR